MVFLILLFFLIPPHSIFASDDTKITSYSSKGSSEWIEIFNNSLNSIDLSGWNFKDADNNPKTLSGCISPNSNKIFDYYQFLNDKEGETLSLYNQKEDLIHYYGSLEIVQKDKPIITSTCELCSYTYSNWGSCSSSGTRTRTYTSSPNNCFGVPETTTESCTYIAPTTTPAPTNTPTPDPTIINPESGISINEFMPYGSTSDKEWVELFNNKDQSVKLIAWKIMDSNSGTRSFDLFIGAKSYGVVEFSSGFLNNDGDKVILINNNGKEMDNREYSGNNYSLDYSWSLVSGSWCRAEISKGTLNNQNCYLVPTSIPTSGPTATPTTDPTKYTTDESATESAIIEPKSESSFITPEISSEPSPTITSSLVLGDSTSSATTPKKNYLPLILIIVGGILLISPTIITKIKLKK